MSELVFSSWANADLDSRKTVASAEEVSIPKEMPDGTALAGIMGWDGIAIWSGADPVDMARAFAKGLAENSCGQCVPCRVGSSVILRTLSNICAGNGESGDVENLSILANRLRKQAMCDLGQSCGKAFIDFVENFSDELSSRIANKTVTPAGEYITTTTAPCKSACPAHLDIPTYVERIKEGKFEESLSIIRQDNCLPGTVGRICVRPCEFNCRRSNVDGPIQIKFLKRFVADYEVERKRPTNLPAPPAPGGGKVAVVGAGPAGLSCSYFLTQLGYEPVVFEALGEPGGMAAVGIPDYRLPRNVLRHEVDLIAGMGAEIRYNTDVGTDVPLSELTGGDYKAVFLGHGARLGTSMGVDGEGDYRGFYKGADYLRDVALGREVYTGDTAIIVGGGNVAIDCARTALRMGFKDVKIVYRRSLKEMPADDVEVADAVAENIEMMVLHNPVRIVSEDGKVTGVEVVRMELGEPDESGRRRPVEVKGSETVVPADACIMAIGQGIDTDFLKGSDDIEITRWQTVKVEGLNKLAAVRDGVGIFAGGDCETGPLTLIAGLAAGKEAAFQIDRFIKDGSSKAMDEWVLNKYVEGLKPYDGNEDVGQKAALEPAKIHHLPVESRVKTMDEVEIGFTHEEAIREASRCLRCYRLLVAAKAG
ncbi:MAG: dihydropyrimidine dehydrogenase subunit A [Deltaproteobacteria bacterium]|nr:MAG: dihydropyrimidine dehydrogenase subunit A [Deltaproteobacteria bacterium]